MSEEKQELTVEEMKSAVSMAAVLPAILKEISDIKEAIEKLSNEFNEMKLKFNDNTKAVITYSDNVDKIIKTMPNTKLIEDKLDSLHQAFLLMVAPKIDNNRSLIMKKETEKVEEKEEPKPAKEEKKPSSKKDKDKDEMNRIIDEILKSHFGRKTRTLTDIQIKQGFKCDDEMAARVLKSLEDKRMYNPKTHILTFPKR